MHLLLVTISLFNYK